MKLLGDFFSVVSENAESEYVVKLNPQHPIFSAHFPGNPIVPGVSQIQMVTELVERNLKKSLFLSKVSNIKYLSVLSPKDVTEISIVFKKVERQKNSLRLSILYKTEQQVYSKISLTYLLSE